MGISLLMLSLLAQDTVEPNDTLSSVQLPEPDSSASTVVRFKGGFMHYDARTKLVRLRDSAWVQTGDVQLEADTVLFWQEAQIVHAKGNFQLVTGNNITRGDSLRYNIRTTRGIAYTSRAFVDKGWVRGKAIYKMSKDELCLQSGDFTTCEEIPPHYSFVAYRMRVIKDDIAVVWPLVAKIKDIPVAVAPFWFFPIKRDRSSGFLTPRVGYHSQDGKYFRNVAYYLALNNYIDITLGTDLLERRGPRFFTRLVYNRYKSLSGNVLFTYANDIYEHTYRWSVDGIHSQRLLGFDIGAQASFLSDVSYRQDYSEDKTEFLRSESYSYLSVYRLTGPVSSSIVLDKREDLIRGSTQSNLPAVDLSLNTQTLGPVSFSASSNFLRYAWRDSSGLPDESAQAGQFSSNFDLAQFSLLRFFRFTPSASAKAVWFALDTLGNANPVQLSSSYSITANTALYGLGDFRIWRFTRFLHTMTPNLSLSYTPKPKELAVQPIGGISPSKEEFALSYGIGNTFDGKWAVNDSTSSKMTIARFDISNSYDILADSQAFGPVDLSLNLLPDAGWRGFSFNTRATASYDLYGNGLTDYSQTTSLSFTVAPDTQAQDTAQQDTTAQDTAKPTEQDVIKSNQPEIRPWKFSLSHNFSPGLDTTAEQTHSLSLSAQGNITTHWFVSYRVKYDLVQGRVMDQSMSLTRDLHCWEMNLSWNTFGSYWTYNLSFIIKNLPDIELKRGFFELFLPK